MFAKLWAGLTLFIAVSISVGAQDFEPSHWESEGDVDWKTGKMTLTLTCPLPPGEDIAPKKRYLGELFLQRHLEEAFLLRAGAVQADSAHTLSDWMKKDPEILQAVREKVPDLQFLSSQISDNSQLILRYSLSLYDLAGVAADVETPNPIAPVLQWVASRPFSGLVIFAMGPMPWKGTGLNAKLKPALSFRLLNPEGEVLVDLSNVQPQFVRKWGMAAYQESKFNEESWRDRIGFDPLRLVARGVWGQNPTDLVLAQDDWDRLLASDENRKFLSEGRILILWGDLPNYKETPNPDSAIDPEQPPIIVIPQPPPPASTSGKAGGH